MFDPASGSKLLHPLHACFKVLGNLQYVSLSLSMEAALYTMHLASRMGPGTQHAEDVWVLCEAVPGPLGFTQPHAIVRMICIGTSYVAGFQGGQASCAAKLMSAHL